MDGLESRRSVFVIAATKGCQRYDSEDDAEQRVVREAQRAALEPLLRDRRLDMLDVVGDDCLHPITSRELRGVPVELRVRMNKLPDVQPRNELDATLQVRLRAPVCVRVSCFVRLLGMDETTIDKKSFCLN